MSFYRDTYLKSDDWKSLRAIKLHRRNGVCTLCQKSSMSNDVHHVKYRNLYDVSLRDLRVLCRSCHDWVHALMEKYPKMKSLSRDNLWSTICAHFERSSRYKDAQIALAGRRTQRFGALRKKLFSQGRIFKQRMKCSDVLVLLMPESAFESEETLLSEFIKQTGINPSRNDGFKTMVGECRIGLEFEPAEHNTF